IEFVIENYTKIFKFWLVIIRKFFKRYLIAKQMEFRKTKLALNLIQTSAPACPVKSPCSIGFGSDNDPEPG
ncbi:MAG: hypothetical protein ACOYIK_05655, partial [Coriobacteriales bacterium]